MSFDARFARFASYVSRLAGSPVALIGALLVILVWAITGPSFNYSDFWQLTINTGTTIVTFLMVFLIQNSQNRDSHAMQIKLDELIRATTHAHNSLLDLEELTERDLEKFRAHYCQLAKHARKSDFNLGAVLAELETEEKEMEAALKEEQRLALRKKKIASDKARKNREKSASISEVAEDAG